MTNETLMKISQMFCGNEGDYFNYKTGSQLVRFFNEYFGYKDIYKAPFPSRHVYLHNKLVELYNSNKLEKFFNIILNKSYIMKEFQISESEASDKIVNIYQKFNYFLNMDGYLLQKKDTKFFLIKENDDLVFVGSGGFADVYKQKSTGLIIKKLKEDFWQDKGIVHRFKREFDITKSLNDLPFIIKVYDYNSNNYSYTMEEAELTLEDYIIDNDLNDDNKINVIRQFLQAIKVVHERDIIHRDISPNNIFIISGMLKIADFGLGKDLNILNSHQTLYTNAVGQFSYCAPEQFMMLKEGDKRSDVFSLGRLINFVMTKDPRNDNHMFRTLVNKATNENPVHRFENAGELLEKLNNTIEYNKNTKHYEQCYADLTKGIFNETIEQYIYELPGNDIVNMLVSKNTKLNSALLNFMSTNYKNAEYLITSIEDSYKDECVSFSSYDGVADFVYDVIVNDFDFVIKESACRILKYIANYVNRFHAQDLVEELLSKGIEPLLEEIFK